MRYIAIGTLSVLLAVASMVVAMAVELPPPGEVLVPLLDTSLPEWQRMEAAGDIQFDPETGDYRIYWTSADGTRKFWVFEPASKVRAKVEAEVSRDASGAYIYRYTVHNLDSSPQNLKWFQVRYDDTEIYDAVKPGELWRFSPHVSMLDAPEPVATWAARLWPDATDADVPGIPPGQTASGFGFTSRQPPGIVICYARGYVRGVVIMDPNPEAAGDPRPNMMGDCAIGTTIGPVPQTSALSSADGHSNLTLAQPRNVPQARLSQTTPRGCCGGDAAAQASALVASADNAVHQEANLVGWVGLREAFAGAGSQIYWQPRAGLATVVNGSLRARVWVGRETAFVNGRAIRLAAPPRLVNGRVEVPLSFLVEAEKIARGTGQPLSLGLIGRIEPSCQKCHKAPGSAEAKVAKAN